MEINATGLVARLADAAVANPDASMKLEVPFAFRKRGVEAKLVIENADHPIGGPDARLIETIARGCSWFEQIAAGKAQTIREIAKRGQIDEGDVSRMVGLAFLAPDIVEAVATGKQPLELTTQRLKQLGSLPHSWPDQRRALGFRG